MARKVTIVLDAVINNAATTGCRKPAAAMTIPSEIVAHRNQKIGTDQPDGGAAVGDRFRKRGKNRRRPFDGRGGARQRFRAQRDGDIAFGHRGGVIDLIAYEQDALAFLLSLPHDGDLLFRSEPAERFPQRFVAAGMRIFRSMSVMSD